MVYRFNLLNSSRGKEVFIRMCGVDKDNISEKMAELACGFEKQKPVFIALGDENRQRIIITLLGNYGGMRVGQITEQTNLSRPAVSHHLRILRDAGIISMFKRGTMNFYYVDGNESQWEELTALILKINTLVKEIAEKQLCSLSDDED